MVAWRLPTIFSPARDDTRLDEAELAEGGPADIRHQVRDGPGCADARGDRAAWWQGASAAAFRLLRPNLLRGCFRSGAFSHSGVHAISGTMTVDGQSQPEQDVAARLLRHYRKHARMLPWRSPRRARRCLDPIACGSAKSCCSKPPSRRSFPISETFTARWPTRRGAGASGRRRSDGAWGRPWLLVRGRETCWPARALVLREILGAASPRRKKGCAHCPASRPIPPRRDRRDRLRASAPW